jgi:hypothetical protein
MKKADIWMAAGVILFFAPFFIFKPVYDWYLSFNGNHPLIMAFLKFAILATFGEVLGLRIKTGKYNTPGFGIVPRAIVWGFLGIWIAVAMGVYKFGVPAYLSKFPLFESLPDAMKGSFSGMKLFGAFCISVMMNTTFAPVFMTIHKITDAHIGNCKGKLNFLTTPLPFGKLISQVNWNIQWGFVFKKTIPFFWIPAHTITFILPGEFQVLFAALLGIALGLILSIAALKSNPVSK